MSLSSSGRPETLPERMDRDLDDVPAWIRQGDGAMGERLIKAREWIDRMEAYFADGLRSFDRSGDYGADGALSVTSWLRWKCKLSGGAAMERVEVARQLNQLPKFEAALARGDIGYQHAAVMAKSAGHLGVAAVRKEEANLLTAAQTMDPGQFVGVAKNFEHRVDAEGALAEANRAYGRRYLHISEPQDGGGPSRRVARRRGWRDFEDGARGADETGKERRSVVRPAASRCPGRALPAPTQRQGAAGRGRSAAAPDHSGQRGHGGRPGWCARRAARGWRDDPCRDRPAVCLRLCDHPDHRTRRARARDQPG